MDVVAESMRMMKEMRRISQQVRMGACEYKTNGKCKAGQIINDDTCSRCSYYSVVRTDMTKNIVAYFNKLEKQVEKQKEEIRHLKSQLGYVKGEPLREASYYRKRDDLINAIESQKRLIAEFSEKITELKEENEQLRRELRE